MGVCRSIKVLRKQVPPATRDDIHAAALQFVRKISGFPKPSRSNEAIFQSAVEEITRASEKLLEGLNPTKS